MDKRKFPLRIVAWELTRSCNLACLHCRAQSTKNRDINELTTDECKSLIDAISSFSSPIVILTGGEPLLRSDIFEIIEHGNKKGLHIVLATNGSLISREVAKRIKELKVKRVSLSLDGKDKESHDTLRGVNGCFEIVIEAAKILKDEEIPFQINTTVTSINIGEIGGIYELTKSLGAVAWHLFLLVTVGRGKNIKDRQLTAVEYERTLNHVYTLERKKELEIKVTCAPQYYRILKENGETIKTRGCLAGINFMFISHVGLVQPCGYLEVICGDIKKENVERIWTNSPIFQKLRDYSNYKGKCGRCKYIGFCGGCRARAYEEYGDFLEEEPYCTIS